MLTHRTMAFAATLLLLVLSGCAPAVGERAAGDQAEAVEIRVENELPGLAGVTVHLMVPGGGSRFLGSLSAAGVTEFEIHGPATGEYQLVAESAGGRRIASERFFLTGSGVLWNLSTNVVLPLAA